MDVWIWNYKHKGICNVNNFIQHGNMGGGGGGGWCGDVTLRYDSSYVNNAKILRYKPYKNVSISIYLCNVDRNDYMTVMATQN